MIVGMEGKGEKGRPWKNGPENGEEGMKIKGIENLQAVAKNWKEWRRIILEGMEEDHTGSEGTEQNVELEKKNKKKRNKKLLKRK